MGSTDRMLRGITGRTAKERDQVGQSRRPGGTVWEIRPGGTVREREKVGQSKKTRPKRQGERPSETVGERDQVGQSKKTRPKRQSGRETRWDCQGERKGGTVTDTTRELCTPVKPITLSTADMTASPFAQYNSSTKHADTGQSSILFQSE